MRSFYQLLQWFFAVGEIVMCYLFVGTFENDIFDLKEKVHILCWGFVIGTLLAFNRRGDDGLVSWFMMIIQCILIFISLLHKKRKKKAFTFSIILAYNVYSVFIQLLFCFIMVTVLKDVGAYEIYMQFSLYRVLCYFFSLIIIIIVYYCVKCSKKDMINLEHFQKSFALYGIAGIFLISALQTQIINYGKESSERNSVFLIELIAATFFILISSMKNMKIREDTYILEFKNKILEENYQEIRNMYHNNMYRNHDIKNHLIIINNFCVQGNVTAAVDYIKSISNFSDVNRHYISSNNIILDIILNYKLGEAERKEIEVETMIDEMDILLIKENDICAILSNLLDNAIEACDNMNKGKKWIKIVIRLKGDMLIICVSNSFSGKYKEENGKYVTIKEGTHGFGMKSVKAKVEKYGGNVEWGHKNDTFIATITFFDCIKGDEK